MKVSQTNCVENLEKDLVEWEGGWQDGTKGI